MILLKYMENNRYYNHKTQIILYLLLNITMKKYILTETQVQRLIHHVMQEEELQEMRGQVLKIKDLAEIASRTGYDYKTVLDIFVKVFKDEGDQGVMELFKSATDLELEDMGHGRYAIK